jgi:hypothetical protein
MTSQNIIVWDIETIPDLAAATRIYCAGEGTGAGSRDARAGGREKTFPVMNKGWSGNMPCDGP